jgi:hypothetical protein
MNETYALDSQEVWHVVAITYRNFSTYRCGCEGQPLQVTDALSTSQRVVFCLKCVEACKK